jgi:oxygen-independent coproporphyrinogen-3 oxidase
VDGRRWWNIRTPDRYIDAVNAGAPVEASSETLDIDQRRSEGQQLKLRTRDGVKRSAFDQATLELVGDMLVEHPTEPDRVVLTRSGRLMANDISIRLSD